MGRLQSRILRYLSEDILQALNRICRDPTIRDNNQKSTKILNTLDKFNVDYSYLGTGTNRVAVLIDGYVFKIAMDRLGVNDNWAELSLTQELQPVVTKVYECNNNGLILVAEYVELISKSSFEERADEIRDILSTIADRYLLGDIGTVLKNYTNWGCRDDGDLVILDFAYIYRIEGKEMICGALLNEDGLECDGFLEYDDNFYYLICSKCGKKYLFTDIRMRINPDIEESQRQLIKQLATKMNSVEMEVEDEEDIEPDDQPHLTLHEREDRPMVKYGKDEYIMDEEDSDMNEDTVNEKFAEALAFMRQNQEFVDSQKQTDTHNEPDIQEEVTPPHEVTESLDDTNDESLEKDAGDYDEHDDTDCDDTDASMLDDSDDNKSCKEEAVQSAYNGDADLSGSDDCSSDNGGNKVEELDKGTSINVTLVKETIPTATAYEPPDVSIPVSKVEYKPKEPESFVMFIPADESVETDADKLRDSLRDSLDEDPEYERLMDEAAKDKQDFKMRGK